MGLGSASPIPRHAACVAKLESSADTVSEKHHAGTLNGSSKDVCPP
jgi:hypothetical protein